MYSDNCEIINETFPLTIDTFLSLMWSDSPFWSKMMNHSNQYDFTLVNKDENSVVYCSKLKMLNFNVPIFNIPNFCEQQTHLDFERDGDKLIIDSVTQAAQFPFADTFEIVQK